MESSLTNIVFTQKNFVFPRGYDVDIQIGFFESEILKFQQRVETDIKITSGEYSLNTNLDNKIINQYWIKGPDGTEFNYESDNSKFNPREGSNIDLFYITSNQNSPLLFALWSPLNRQLDIISKNKLQNYLAPNYIPKDLEPPISLLMQLLFVLLWIGLTYFFGINVFVLFLDSKFFIWLLAFVVSSILLSFVSSKYYKLAALISEKYRIYNIEFAVQRELKKQYDDFQMKSTETLNEAYDWCSTSVKRKISIIL